MRGYLKKEIILSKTEKPEIQSSRNVTSHGGNKVHIQNRAWIANSDAYRKGQMM